MTPTQRKAMEQALEALEMLTDDYDDGVVGLEVDAIAALRDALAEPQGEPGAITNEQALALWHISQEAHRRISAFEWFHAGIIAAEHFHAIAPEAPKPAKPAEHMLTKFKPEQQEQLRQWLADGTFVERALGTMWEQELELANKPNAPQPAIPPGYKLVPSRCPLCEYQYGHQIGCENNPVDIHLRSMAATEAPQPAKREPLTDKQIDAAMRKALGYGLSPSRDDLDFARAIERAHGIGEKK